MASAETIASATNFHYRLLPGTPSLRFPMVSYFVLCVSSRRGPLRNPFNPQSLISHLTNSNGCGNLWTKVLLTCPRFVLSLLRNPVCILATSGSSRRMRHVTPISPPFSIYCAYFPSPRGCHPVGIPRPYLCRLCALCVPACPDQLGAVNPMFSAVCRLLKSLYALFRTRFLCFQ